MFRSIVWPLGGALLILLGGCSGTVKRLSAKDYYSQATDAYTREDYTVAADNYQELLDQYPLNPYAEESQLKIAYSLYLNKKYTEALAAFGDFERAYPTSSHLPFVQYYRGMAYLEQMRSIDRDQSVTEKANDFFRIVIDRYADSPFARLAEQKSKVCRETLAAHELYIADFHQGYGLTRASKNRLRNILEKYPETDTTTIVLDRLQNIFTEENKPGLADLAAKAAAARQLGIPTSPLEVSSTEEEEQVTPPAVDPLLPLLTEMRRLEEEERKEVQQQIQRAREEQAVKNPPSPEKVEAMVASPEKPEE
jgi:outer membrane protein assembly factor BamD